MDHQELKAKVRTLIAANKIEEAIELLANAQFSALDKELIVLNSQYNRIAEEMRLNLVSKDEGERRMNTITMALIDLSDKIGAEPSRLSELSDAGESSGRRKFLLIGIPVLVVLTGLIIWAVLKNDKPANPDTTVDVKGDDSTTIDLPSSSEEPFKLPESRVAAYLFNGNANDTVSDHHGSVHGAAVMQDRFKNNNYAYYFNGVSAHIKFPLILDPSATNYSLACWIKSERENGAIFGQYINSIPGKDQSGKVYVAVPYVALSGGYLTLDQPGGRGVPGDNPSSLKFSASTRIPLNEWVHLALIRKDKSISLYINGKLTDSDIPFNAPLPTEKIRKAVDYAIIGARPLGAYDKGKFFQGQSFKGSIDDLYLFNDAIDEATVKKLFSTK